MKFLPASLTMFPTLSFGLFFLVVLALTWSAWLNDWRKLILLIASWIFYGAWDFRVVLLLIGSALGNWWIAAAIDLSAERRQRKLLMLTGVALNLLVLGTFKYAGFMTEQLGATLAYLGFERDLPVLAIILPIGISFFTFQGISYVVDVYHRRVPPAAPIDILLLMSFFPHLVAGPIVRAAHLVPQFRATPRLDRGMAAMGLLLIVWGLFKKTVVASELATSFVDGVFDAPASHSGSDLVIGAYGYAVQIYCDFSAYSDMAIGLAALLGYRFPRNFDQPYRAASLREFWQRWHITLSQWLRDYLYIGALGGGRGPRAFVYRNLMATMLLGGLWHGAKWTFVIWGGLHGAALVAERMWAADPRTARHTPPRWVRVLVTFHVVLLAWVFFRAQSFADAMTYLGAIVVPAGDGRFTATPLVLALIAFGLAMHWTPPDLMPRLAARMRAWPAAWAGVALGAAILLVDAMRFEGVAPFIYYRF